MPIHELPSSPDTADSISLPTLDPPDTESHLNGSTSEAGCRVSRRLGTVWRGAETPRSERPRSGKTQRISRIRRLRRGSAARPLDSGDSSLSDQDLSDVVDLIDIAGSSPPDLEAAGSGPIELNSGSDSDEELSIYARHGLIDPDNGDDVNCLNCFAAYSAVELWTVDMRLTLLWCLAYEARFRRRGPALELWLAIIEGTRDRVDWGMWEDGDESWLRNMIIQHQMTHRFRVPTLKLSTSDWILARDALERRIRRPKPSTPSPRKAWSTEHRVLRIAWCTVTDGVPAVGGRYLDLMQPIDCWTYYTCPFRYSYDRDMKLRLHSQPQCSFSSCKVGVWQWFKTAIIDYDLAQVRDVMDCCDSCISRYAFNTFFF
jgi:hypothetical protein